jgi:uncharacterized protein DUF5317
LSLLIALVIGVALGFALGGRLGHLIDLPLRWTVLIFLALVLQLILFGPVNVVPAATVPALYLVSNGIAAVWVIRNLAIAGLPCIGLGAASNLLAITANGGRMPVDARLLTQTRGAAFAQAVAQHRVATNAVIADSGTRLAWLTDRFVFPPPLPSPVVFSVGDVLIGVGVVWLIAAGMRTATKIERLS